MQGQSKEIHLLLLILLLSFADPSVCQPDKMERRVTLTYTHGMFKKTLSGGKFKGPLESQLDFTMGVGEKCSLTPGQSPLTILSDPRSCEKEITVCPSPVIPSSQPTMAEPANAITLCAGKGVELYKRKGGIIFYHKQTKEAMMIKLETGIVVKLVDRKAVEDSLVDRYFPWELNQYANQNALLGVRSWPIYPNSDKWATINEFLFLVDVKVKRKNRPIPLRQRFLRGLKGEDEATLRIPVKKSGELLVVALVLTGENYPHLRKSSEEKLNRDQMLINVVYGADNVIFTLLKHEAPSHYSGTIIFIEGQEKFDPSHWFEGKVEISQCSECTVTFTRATSGTSAKYVSSQNLF